ncbi:MAG: methyltransferase domain-containing protein [Alcaligenaceae bacterium]|nr:methyltransferase domain-containing protein [Alcaligenaceae bacterium]
MRGPGMVGAVCSSSRYLATEMAGLVPPGNGLVIELGAGTGMVTQALLDHGISPRRLIIVERSEGFVAHLRHRFPEATVIHGDAANLCELIPQGLPIAAIVSSLPLRSLPADQRTQIIAQWRQALSQDGSLIQFTYDIRPQTHTCASDHAFSVTHSRIVWANLPPARVLHARLSVRTDSLPNVLAVNQPADPSP